MRIDNDTTSYSGNQLTHSHHHHITNCLMDEESSKRQTGAMGVQKDTYQSSTSNTAQGEQEAIGIGIGTAGRSGRIRLGKGFVREIWDAMGDEGTSAKKGTSPLHDRTADQYTRGIYGVSAMVSSLRQNLSYYVVNKWENVREKIRTGIHTSLKRFGKDKDGFTMLSDAGNQTDGRKGTKEWKKEEDRKGTRISREEIPTAYPADNHLMDSYSKNGEYCRLNENLTYKRK